MTFPLLTLTVFAPFIGALLLLALRGLARHERLFFALFDALLFELGRLALEFRETRCLAGHGRLRLALLLQQAALALLNLALLLQELST